MGPEPYFWWYAATKALLPGELSSWNQSPAPKMPLTLFEPTLVGKLTGSFDPLERNSIFGLKCCSIMALTSLKASSDCVPPTTMSGFAAAILDTIGE